MALFTTYTMAANVITWVPPYSIPECKNTLEADFGGIGMKDGLTHLALQFWVPNGPEVAKIQVYGNISDDDIIWFRDWGRQHDIKVMLCIFNAENGWDWDLGVNSFVNNQDDFVASVLAEIDRLELDGAEIDIEGPGAGNEYQDEFHTFCTRLADSLHPQGKHVTVASFAYIWNAPNSDWWPGLMEVVDGITSMGYDEIGRNADGWASYAGQKELAPNPSKLMIGMMGGNNSWQGNNALEQLDWVVEDGECGVAIWDAALGGSLWESAEAWEKLALIKNSGDTTVHTFYTEKTGPLGETLNADTRNHILTVADLRGRLLRILSDNQKPAAERTFFRKGTIYLKTRTASR
jgi:hypothetical protein